MKKIVVALLAIIFLNTANAEFISSAREKDPTLPVSAVMLDGIGLTSVDNANSWQAHQIGYDKDVSLTDIVWANNQFVALGYDSARATAATFASSDGANWVTTAANLPGYLGRIMYANHLYFATGNDTGLYTSNDGKQWTSFPSPTAPGCNVTDLAGVAWGNNVYVLTGLCGSFRQSNKQQPNGEQYFTATSTDAINWTVTPQQYNFNDVIWSQNQFIAVGSLGVVASSSDGIKWTTLFNDNALLLNRVIYANNMYVAIGTKGAPPNYTAIILTSHDGVTWTELSFKNQFSLKGITFKNNQFFVTGSDNASKIFTSADALNWKIQATESDFSISSIG